MQDSWAWKSQVHAKHSQMFSVAYRMLLRLSNALFSYKINLLLFLKVTGSDIYVTRRNYPSPRRGDTFHEFATRENYPPPLTKKIR